MIRDECQMKYWDGTQTRFLCLVVSLLMMSFEVDDSIGEEWQVWEDVLLKEIKLRELHTHTLSGKWKFPHKQLLLIL